MVIRFNRVTRVAWHRIWDKEGCPEHILIVKGINSPEANVVRGSEIYKGVNISMHRRAGAGTD